MIGRSRVSAIFGPYNSVTVALSEKSNCTNIVALVLNHPNTPTRCFCSNVTEELSLNSSQNIFKNLFKETYSTKTNLLCNGNVWFFMDRTTDTNKEPLHLKIKF